MKHTRTFAALLISLSWLMSTGCSHSPSVSAQSHPADAEWSLTSIEIDYNLRHAHRRLTIEPNDQGIQAQSLLEGTPLKKTQIDHAHYQEFLTKVQTFLNHKRSIASETPAANSPDCRAPYSITLKNQKDTIKTQGCRMNDEGAFSHLIQDGEFLIYRQK